MTTCTYATAQAVGTRDVQCDATAVFTAPSGARAYVLLDGIGLDEEVRSWTREAARRLARTAARHTDAESGLHAVYQYYATDSDWQSLWDNPPAACAVVAVTVPGQPLTIAWCGDARAYLLTQGTARRLTEDHNARRVYPPTATYPTGGSRNVITSSLGTSLSDERAQQRYGHPVIESVTRFLDGPCRLLLASDGAYQPHEDAGHDLFVELDDDPLTDTARRFVTLAVETSLRVSGAEDPARPYADNATVLVADLQPTN